jgi:hypothetical protein
MANSALHRSGIIRPSIPLCPIFIPKRTAFLVDTGVTSSTKSRTLCSEYGGYCPAQAVSCLGKRACNWTTIRITLIIIHTDLLAAVKTTRLAETEVLLPLWSNLICMKCCEQLMSFSSWPIDTGPVLSWYNFLSTVLCSRCVKRWSQSRRTT